MTDFADVYSYLRTAYPNNKRRGGCLERIVADVLRSDPKYQGVYSDVWMWNDWPGRRSADIGVDIVAKPVGINGLTAIQVKCYDPKRTLKMEDVTTFLANTNADFTKRILVSTTRRYIALDLLLLP